MRLFPFSLALLMLLVLVNCGHKKPPKPFPPLQANYSQNKTAGVLIKGAGGYFIGDDGFIILYWDIPAKVDHFEVYKGFKLVGTTESNTFLVKEPIKETTIFRVVGYRGKKPVGEVFIKVSP